jgi:AcrR family transcriptional regulator
MVNIEQLVQDGLVTDPSSPKGALLRTATNLFRLKGYDRTTVRDLARALGIQSGSLFHHFKSKEDILATVMAETIVVCTEQLRLALAGAHSTQEKLLALIKCEIQSIVGDQGESLGVVVLEWSTLSEARREPLLSLRANYEGLWLQVLQEAQEAGLLVMEPAIMRRFLTGALSWIDTWYNPEGELQADELARLALRMLIGHAPLTDQSV